MANWKEVTERWLPIVENMEAHHMNDYAIPEIYRAAQNEMCRIINEVQSALEAVAKLKETNDD